MKPGQYLFRKHGGKVVFFGRFIAVLRALAAALAGTNRLSWAPFLFSTRWEASSGHALCNKRRLEGVEHALPGPLDALQPAG